MFSGFPVEFDHLLMTPTELKKESAEVKVATKSIPTLDKTIENLFFKESQNASITTTTVKTTTNNNKINSSLTEEIRLYYYIK